MGPQRHLIKRQLIEIEAASNVDAIRLQSDLSRIYYQQFVPIIEHHLNQIASPNEVVQIDVLDLDLGTIDPTQLEEELVSKLREVLPKALASYDKASTMPQSSFAQSHVQAANSHDELLGLFLRTGNVPWWTDKADSALVSSAVAQLLQKDARQLQTLLLAHLNAAQSVRRLVTHLDDAALIALASLLLPESLQDGTWLEAMVALFQSPPATLARTRVWATFLQQIISARKMHIGAGALPRFLLTALLSRSKVSARTLLESVQNHSELAKLLRRISNEEIKGTKLWESLSPNQKDALLADTGGDVAAAMLLAGEMEPSHLFNLEGPDEVAIDSAEQSPDLTSLWERLSPNQRAALLAETDGDVAAAMVLAGEMEPSRLSNSSGGDEVAIDSAEQSPDLTALWKRLSPNQRAALLAETDGDVAAAMLLVREMAQSRLFELADSDEMASDSAENDMLQSPNADEIYVNNAGLVLLWPFLTRFFARLELLSEQKFTDHEKQQTAIALLQFLATGTTQLVEYQLPLNKVLCGLSPESLFVLDVPLLPEAIDECEHLLQAVIANAPMLGTISPDSLRGSFLLRDGILRIRDGAWLLQVERATYDIILERLPWSFEWVRLPWMTAPLRVEWR